MLSKLKRNPFINSVLCKVEASRAWSKIQVALKGAEVSGIEIERKWHFSGSPMHLAELQESAIKVEYIRQWYIQKPTSKVVARIRNVYTELACTEQYHEYSELTMKAGRGLVRQELNADIEYNQPSARNIHKTRYHFLLGNGMPAIMDVYHGANHGLVHIEVEYKDKATANAFEAPHSFGKEVTKDMAHTNAQLQINPFRTW